MQLTRNTLISFFVFAGLLFLAVIVFVFTSDVGVTLTTIAGCLAALLLVFNLSRVGDFFASVGKQMSNINPPSSRPAASTPVYSYADPSRYWALTLLIKVLKVLAGLTVAWVVILVLVVGLGATPQSFAWLGDTGALLLISLRNPLTLLWTVGSTLFSALLMFASAQFIELMIDIEGNTRRSSDALERRLNSRERTQ